MTDLEADGRGAARVGDANEDEETSAMGGRASDGFKPALAEGSSAGCSGSGESLRVIVVISLTGVADAGADCFQAEGRGSTAEPADCRALRLVIMSVTDARISSSSG